MAQASRDQNRIPTLIGVDSADLTTTTLVAVDSVTNRLLVSAVITAGGSGGIQYTEADTDASITGTALLWEDTSDTLRSVSATKPLPVNIVAGSSSGTEYADGAARGTSTGVLAMGDDGTNIQSVHVDSSGDLQIDVLTMPTVAVTGTFYQATQPVSGTFYQATQPVSGTFWQATQPISGTVTANLGTIADVATQTTLALIKTKTDNIPAQGQALAAASVPVVLTAAQITTLTPPAAITGFATETTLSAINAKMVSGTDIGDVTINNAAGASAVNIQDGGNSITVDGTVAFSNSTIAVTNTGTFAVQADTELTTGDLDTGVGTDTRAVVGLVLAASGGGALLGTTNPMPISDNAGSITVDGTFWQATQPVSGTFWQATQPVSGTVAFSNSTIAVTNIGTFAVQATLAAETTKVIGTVNQGTSPWVVSGAVTNTVLSVVGGGTEATAQRVTIATDSTGVLSVDDNGGSLTVDGTFWQATQPVSIASVPSHAVTNAGTFATQSTLVAAATGGATPYKLVSAATTNATSVKASAGTVYLITASNVNAAARYLKLYNKASAPTVGTDTPVFTFIIPGNTAGAGTNIPLPAMGVNFSTGIAFALTTGIADADTGAVAASDIAVNLAYV